MIPFLPPLMFEEDLDLKENLLDFWTNQK